jgi:hypothetical protein
MNSQGTTPILHNPQNWAYKVLGGLGGFLVGREDFSPSLLKDLGSSGDVCLGAARQGSDNGICTSPDHPGRECKPERETLPLLS